MCGIVVDDHRLEQVSRELRAKIQQWIYHIRGSYWFVPTLMAIGAIVLSQVVLDVDRRLGAKLMSEVWWASLNEPEGARALLATVAGSMITVAGVTFSLTILAVSYGTSQFGPRLLDNFMHDRGNQLTLGTFLATFLYCLLVLRTVRSGSKAFGTAVDADVFVPHLSVGVAIALTIASVGVLIYFIHHIPESMHISNVLDRISDKMIEMINQLFPDTLGEGIENSGDSNKSVEPVVNVVCSHAGYLQGIDEAALIDFTRQHDATVELLVRPGDYLLQGQLIALIGHCSDHDATACGEPDTDECASQVHAAMAVGISRTPTQDLFFILNQFVEIAARALSPGVNDPFTAKECIDQLGRGFVLLSQRSLPSRFRHDDDGKLRIVTTEPTWDALVDSTFVQLVPYVERDPNVTAHLLRTIERVCAISQNHSLNQLLRDVEARLNAQ